MLADLAILVLLLIFALNGYRRGLLVLAGRLLILGASLVLSLLLLGPTAKVLDYLPFMSPLIQTLNDKIIRPLLPAAGNLKDAVLALALPEPIQDLLLATFPNPQSPLTDAWPSLSSTLAQYVITTVVFILLLTVISIVLMTIVSVMSDILDQVPVVGGLNRLSGLLLGLAHGSLIILLVVLVIGLLTPYIPALSDLQQGSQIIAAIYKQDLIARALAYFWQVI